MLSNQYEYRDKNYLVAFQSVPGLGGRSIRNIIEEYGNAEKAWHALQDDEELRKKGLFSKKQELAIKENLCKEKLDEINKAMSYHDIDFVTYKDKDFPSSLQDIYNPPAVLFIKGNRSLLSHLDYAIAMVGARDCSPYGRNVALRFAKEFANKGVVIVSGGAKGIDGFCHEGAITGGGKTIAVMGCGLDRIYPREHKRLFDSILKHDGLWVSEFPPFVPPLAKNFPARNRIISGLVKAVVVVEAKASSGSLITADMAINDGRDVFAIPGNVLESWADGNHWLLRQGAYVLTQVQDLLDEYEWTEEKLKGANIKSFIEVSNENGSEKSSANLRSMISFTVEESKILGALSTDTPISVDDLIVATKLSLSCLQSFLLSLELKGCIQMVDTQGYILMGHRSDWIGN